MSAGPYVIYDQSSKLISVSGLKHPSPQVTGSLSTDWETDLKNPRAFIDLIDNFALGGSGVGAVGSLPWRVASSGSGFGRATGQDANHPFGIQLNTFTSATANSLLALSLASTAYDCIFASGGQIINEWIIRIGNLSTVSEEYKLRVGMFDRANDTDTAEASNGIYFLYDRLTSVNWQIITGKAGTRTTTDSGIAVAAGAFLTLRSVTNAAGTSVTFYISTNGGAFATAGTISTNIPNTSSNKFTPAINLVKSAGTTQRNLEIFYFRLRQDFTTSR
jgi:hypothetical protein